MTRFAAGKQPGVAGTRTAEIMLLDHTSGRKMPASVCLGSVPKPPANWLTGSGSALPIPAVRVHLPAPPNPLQSSQNLFIPSQKFRPPFQRWRGRGAVRQRKFGFQPKLPGRKRPSSGDFSGFQPEARFARRPLSLPCGLGATGRMLFWIPDQNNARRFSGFQPEARFTRRSGRMRLAG